MANPAGSKAKQKRGLLARYQLRVGCMRWQATDRPREMVAARRKMSTESGLQANLNIISVYSRHLCHNLLSHTLEAIWYTDALLRVVGRERPEQQAILDGGTGCAAGRL